MSNGPALNTTITTVRVLGSQLDDVPPTAYSGARLCAHVQLTAGSGQYQILVDGTKPDSIPAGTPQGPIVNAIIALPGGTPFHRALDGVDWDGSALICHVTVSGDEATLTIDTLAQAVRANDEDGMIQYVLVRGADEGTQELFWVDVPANTSFTSASIDWGSGAGGGQGFGLGGPIGGVTIPPGE